MKHYLPARFEEKDFCKLRRSETLIASIKSRIQSGTGFNFPEVCRKKERCLSGLCHVCMRRFRSNFLRFAINQKFHEREWHLVTIFVDGWTVAPNDFSPFGQLKNNKIILRLLQRIRRLKISDTLLFGCIETVFKTRNNTPLGKPFHIHLMVSGPSKLDLQQCIKECVPLANEAVPLRCDPVRHIREDFIKATSYIIKQPFWKRSESAAGSKRLQSPKILELAELGSNLGAHDVGERFFYIGMKFVGGKLMMT